LSDNNAIISVRDLVFDYSGKRALRGVTFDVPRGSVLALVGPNGAGKTTLMRCIAGLQEPLAGSVSVASIAAAAHRRDYHQQLGYLSDFFGLYDSLSSRRCLSYMASTHGLRGAEAEGAVVRAAQRVDIEPYLEAAAGTLSRGLRQRLAIAMAIVHDPKVLLLDEPAAGLDPEARQSLARLLTQLRQQGTTLIVSSHLLSELEDYSTEMLILNAGRVVEHCPVRSRATARSYVLDVISDKSTALAILQSTPQVQDARIDTDSIVFECEGDKQVLAQLLATLVKHDVAFASFHERMQDMEQRYLTALSRQRGLGHES
jgi:ABC-2 type transport system ATP-binding protein